MIVGDEPSTATDPYRALIGDLVSDPLFTDLRLAFVFDPDAREVVYSRGDLDPTDESAVVGELRTWATRARGPSGAVAQAAYGDVETVISVREQALVLAFLGGADEGLVAVLDRSDVVLSRLFST
ncbi:MAG: hypothetical protein ABEJ77_02705 [Halanaeroarchaeum sp.]